MICPKCSSSKTEVITSGCFYCVDCNYSWKKENGAAEPEGTMFFDGIPKARAIFNALTQGQEYTPEFKAALETQITGILLDQWFEGMKCGQMASILYAKEYYGKDRSGSAAASIPREERASRTDKVGEIRRGRRGQDSSDPRTAMHNITIRERINQIEFTYPRGIMVPENVRQAIANHSESVPVKAASFDGKKLSLEVEF